MKRFSGILIAIGIFASFGVGAMEDVRAPLQREWSFAGPFGTFDRGQLQRGFQVYKEVCAACHGLNYISYRNLIDLGFSPTEIKAIAAEYTVKDGPNDLGEFYERPGRPTDRFFRPFDNDQAARAANNGALPVDLSLVVKARENGSDYVYSLLTGYENPPPGKELPPGRFYNPYFPGGEISMTPPLHADLVSFSDGTRASVDQMATDVTVFLTWASKPTMEQRKKMGVTTIIYLFFFTFILYLLMKRIWRRVDG